MPQIQFSVSEETEVYLRWLADNILFEQTSSKAARHLFLKGLEQTRRDAGQIDPAPATLK